MKISLSGILDVDLFGHPLTEPLQLSEEIPDGKATWPLGQSLAVAVEATEQGVVAEIEWHGVVLVQATVLPNETRPFHFAHGEDSIAGTFSIGA